MCFSMHHKIDRILLHSNLQRQRCYENYRLSAPCCTASRNWKLAESVRQNKVAFQSPRLSPYVYFYYKRFTSRIFQVSGSSYIKHSFVLDPFLILMNKAESWYDWRLYTGLMDVHLLTLVFHPMIPFTY